MALRTLLVAAYILFLAAPVCSISLSDSTREHRNFACAFLYRECKKYREEEFGLTCKGSRAIFSTDSLKLVRHVYIYS